MSVVEGNRNPKDNLQAALKTRGLAQYTIKICANPKVFDPAYDRFLTSRIVETATSIHTTTWAANAIRVNCWDKYLERARLQVESTRACTTMLCLIDMAKPIYHLRGTKVKYWSGLVREARTLIDAWARSDHERYKHLQEAEGK